MTSVKVERLKRVKVGHEWATIFKPHFEAEAAVELGAEGLVIRFGDVMDVGKEDRVWVGEKIYNVSAVDGSSLTCAYDHNETALEELYRAGFCQFGVLEAVRKDDPTERFMDSWVGTYMVNIAEHYHEIRAGRDIKPLFGLAERNVPVACVGAGPSLDKNVHLLKDFPGIIIAVDKAYKMLLARGIEPDLVVSVDCHYDLIADMLKAPGSEHHSLVLNTCADPKILKVWKGKVYWYLMKHPGVQFTDKILPALFPTFSAIPNVGCVGNTAILLADHCGLSPIFLVGYDFGYTGGRMHAQRFGFGDDGKPFPIEDDHAKLFDERSAKIEVDGVVTYVPYVGFAKTAVAIREKVGVDVTNCTGGGIINELPKRPFEDVVRELSQGSDGKFRDLREKIKSL